MLGTSIEALITFIVVIIILLGLDLYFVGRDKHKVGLKEASIWTSFFILVSIAFGVFVYFDLGQQKAIEFSTAYVVEKILSVDNLFVFLLIFSYFKVPDEYQHKTLFYGIIGAIVFRAIFIFTGVKLISLTSITIGDYQVNYLITLFGLFLAYTGIKSVIAEFKEDEDDDTDFNNTIGAKLIRKLFPRITNDFGNGDFFTFKDGKRYATQLLVVVSIIEFSDILFAVDSVPAIISISDDPFILYSSNIFAILGLRSMYFLLANLLPMFKHLGKGVAVILGFIGFKMIVAPIFHVDSIVSLLIILGVLTVSVLCSLLTSKE